MQLMPDTAAEVTGAGRLHAAGQHRGRRAVPAVACSIATAATSRSPWPRTTPDPCARRRGRRHPGHRRDPRVPRPCAPLPARRISGRARVSARPIADAAARPGSQPVVALPNLLSLLRIGLVPVIVVVLFWSGPLARALAAALFLVACITDYLDGWLARRHGVTHARTVPRPARRQAHRRRGADHARRGRRPSRACPRGWRW